MKYIVAKTFNKKGISKEFNLRKGTNCESIDGFIYRNEDKICAVTSQNAYDFFSYNEDNNGQERFDLISQIKEKIQEYVTEYNDAEAEIITSFTEETTDEEKEEALSELIDKSSLAHDILENYNLKEEYALHTASIELLTQVLGEIINL